MDFSRKAIQETRSITQNVGKVNLILHRMCLLLDTALISLNHVVSISPIPFQLSRPIDCCRSIINVLWHHHIQKEHIRLSYISPLKRSRATSGTICNRFTTITRPGYDFLKKVSNITDETETALKRHECDPHTCAYCCDWLWMNRRGGCSEQHININDRRR